MNMIIPRMDFGIELNPMSKGRIGEKMAAMPLEYFGFTTFSVNFEGIDMLVMARDGTPFTVEVKSASRQQRSGPAPGYPNYLFSTRSKINADWVAFCSMDLGVVLFEPHDRSKKQPQTRSIRVEQFTTENMVKSLAVLRETYGH